MDGPRPLEQARDNLAGARTSVDRLNGRVYTPRGLAEAVVAELPLRGGEVWLDPACGDGELLVALVRRARREGLALRAVGWDIDADALRVAEERLREVAGSVVQAELAHRDALDPWPVRPDGVLGNPPYLEAKRMPDALKARVRVRCPVASRGAFDLYGAFVELALRGVRPDGHVALLVPNRLLVTAATEGVRELACASGRVEIADLSTTGAFPGAAVYPVLLRWRGGASGYAVRPLGGEEIFETSGAALHTWPLPERGVPGQLVRRALAAREAGAWSRLDALLDVRWCVSFHRAGLRDAYIFPERPEGSHARRFLGGGRFAGNREVEAYRIAWAGAWIDHDEARAQADRNPLPAGEMFDAPKLVICQNARRCRAAVDGSGLVLKDTFLAGIPRDPAAAGATLAWLALVLNSDLLHVVYEQLYGGTRKGGAFLHFLGRYLGPLPVPPCPDPALAVALHTALARGQGDRDAAEALVRRAWEVSPVEAAWLDAAELPPP